MRIAGIVVLVMALVIAAVPQFTDCESQGKALTLANGRSVPMKCHWTAQAALGLALPLGIAGGLMAFNRRRHTGRNLAAMGAGLGALALLLPTALIGVCASNEMLCRSVMLPTLILAGSLVVVANVAAFGLSLRRRIEVQATAATPGIAA